MDDINDVIKRCYRSHLTGQHSTIIHRTPGASLPAMSTNKQDNSVVVDMLKNAFNPTVATVTDNQQTA